MVERNERFFIKLVEKKAKKRGVAVETILNEIDHTLSIINKKLPEDNRLVYAEDYFKRGEIGPQQVDLILRNNPLHPKEMNRLASTIKKELEMLFSIDFPDYNVRFDSLLNPKNMSAGIEFTDWTKNEIVLPTKGTIFIPFYIAHAYGHAYQMENSALFQHLKDVWDTENKKPYFEERSKAGMVIEGWATFVGKTYAKKRDEQLKQGALYEKFADEYLGMAWMLDIMNKTEANKSYYKGEELFSQISAVSGIHSTIRAATICMNDVQLQNYRA